MPTAARTPTPAAAVRATVRTALRTTWPGVTFTIRGRRRVVDVQWTDGPTVVQVKDVLTTLRRAAPDTPWGYAIGRDVTDQALAVAYLRAHANQIPIYRPAAPGHPHPWHANLDDSLDATTITPAERAAGELTLTLARNHPRWNGTWPALALAATVHEHADAIHATLT